MFLLNYIHNLYNILTDRLISVFDYFDRHRIIKDRLTNESYLERYYLFILLTPLTKNSLYHL